MLFLVLHFEALKIHISTSTKTILEQFDKFDMELRGQVEMKVSETLDSVCSVTLANQKIVKVGSGLIKRNY